MSSKKRVNKILSLSELSLSKKDLALINLLISERKFNECVDLIKAEIKKEYRKCTPENMTERYCVLLDISNELNMYDVDSLVSNKCVNYEEE